MPATHRIEGYYNFMTTKIDEIVQKEAWSTVACMISIVQASDVHTEGYDYIDF